MESILQLFSLTPLDGKMILVCALLFFLLYKALDRCLFSPLIDLVEARETATSYATDAASDLKEHASELARAYDAAILDARVAATKAKFDQVAQARETATKLVQQAEAEAQATLARARDEQQRSRDRLRTEIFGALNDMVEQVITKVSSSGASLR